LVIETNTRRLLLLGSVIAVLMIADGLGRLLPAVDLSEGRQSDGVESVDTDRSFAGGRLPSRAAVRERLRDAVPQIVLGFWSCLCVLAAAGLVWGLKLVECRLCGGVGRLSLEAKPPDGPGFTVDTDCVHCEGQGRLGLLDRWWTS
jgi:hypothetical protein